MSHIAEVRRPVAGSTYVVVAGSHRSRARSYMAATWRIGSAKAGWLVTSVTRSRPGIRLARPFWPSEEGHCGAAARLGVSQATIARRARRYA
jgi:hypothetical protein